MTDIAPRMSVLLVTYNHAKFVAQALDSILMQRTDFEFEIIAVDDCSTDDTLAILRRYEGQHSRLRVLAAETNLGISRNYQRGFAACRGEFVAVLEGDDYWISPRKLQIMSDFLKRNPVCSFCFHRVIRYDPHPEKAALYPPQWTAEQLLTVSELASGNFIGGFSTCVYRREIIVGLKPELWELDIREWFFNIVVAEYGPIGYVPEILSVYRAHPGGIWSMQPVSYRTSELIRLIESYDPFLEFRFTKQFQSFTQEVSRPILPDSDEWPLYWKIRIGIASRLPVRVKKTLKRFLR